MSRHLLSLSFLVVPLCWSCAAPSQPSPPVADIAGAYSIGVSASASCHTLPGINEDPQFFFGNMAPHITLNQRGAAVSQQVVLADFTGNYSADISGTVDAQYLQLATVNLINNNKFDRWNFSGAGIGVIQGGIITGTIGGTFQRLTAGSPLAFGTIVDCTATDHRILFARNP